MIENEYVPNVVDFAREIIYLHNENNRLHRELQHYKELHKMNRESIDSSIKHGREMTGLMLKTILEERI